MLDRTDAGGAIYDYGATAAREVLKGVRKRARKNQPS